MKLNIGFISTRFAGFDGVSLEANKWDEVLTRMGHKTFWFAGELDKDPERSMVVEDAHFRHQENLLINAELFNQRRRPRSVTDRINRVKEYIKDRIYEFIEKFNLDMIVAENCLAIPMQIPLALAITEVIAETGIPAIGHHHDFAWERDRFLVNAINDYLDMAFPPDLPSVRHVVINSIAEKELAMRKGVSSVLIPNVIDFHRNPSTVVDPEKYNHFRKDLGFSLGDILFLQPTRVVARKGIEHAMELVRRLKDPRIKLLISHTSGDEGFEYYDWISDHAKATGVPVFFLENKLERTEHGKKKRTYSLWDIYPHADFITYPSLFEGFGNAFLEAIFYKKPLLVNRYSIFIADIEPKGFEVVPMEGYLTKRSVNEVRELMADKKRQEEMAEKNFVLARKYFSYEVLRKKLSSIFISFYGML